MKTPARRLLFCCTRRATAKLWREQYQSKKTNQLHRSFYEKRLLIPEFLDSEVPPHSWIHKPSHSQCSLTTRCIWHHTQWTIMKWPHFIRITRLRTARIDGRSIPSRAYQLTLRDRTHSTPRTAITRRHPALQIESKVRHPLQNTLRQWNPKSIHGRKVRRTIQSCPASKYLRT